MSLGARIKRFRQQRGWTQDELGERAQVDGRQISRYENDRVQPRTKIIRRLAEVFEVEQEELTRGISAKDHQEQFRDPELYQQFLEVDQLDEEDRFVAKRVLQALLMRKQLQNMLAN